MALVVLGESGVGKSALVLAAATADPDAEQAVCINLRHLPNTTVEFESLLRYPFAMLLAELSAPQRLFVIDAADAVAEGILEQRPPVPRRGGAYRYRRRPGENPLALIQQASPEAPHSL